MTKDEYFMPYFTKSELACKGSGKILLANGFKEQLLTLREKFNQPMKITSCCRSYEYNTKIGGAVNSFHIFNHPTRKPAGTAAIDVAIIDNSTRGKLINLAWSLGWSIGIHKNFLHLDRRSDYKSLEQIVFVY
jgi:hypothetical protein